MAQLRFRRTRRSSGAAIYIQRLLPCVPLAAPMAAGPQTWI